MPRLRGRLLGGATVSVLMLLSLSACGSSSSSSTSSSGKLAVVAAEHFWGAIELQFKDGQIATIRKTETTKLISRRGNNRDAYDNHTTR